MPKSKTIGSGELSFLGIPMWRPQWKHTRLWFVKIKWTAAFLAKMAQKSISRHTGGRKECVHLHDTDTDTWHPNQSPLNPECHLLHPVTMWQLKLPELMVCYSDMCIYILLFPTLNFSMLMCRGRIASAIKILFQTCWLMKKHLLVSTLSAVW